MFKLLPIAAEVEQAQFQLVVSAAPDSEGTAIAETRETARVMLENLSGSITLEYRVAAGAWEQLQERNSVDLPIDLSVSTVRLRTFHITGATVPVRVTADLGFVADPPSVVLSDEDPIDDDGRPDGTIWIKV